jgi:hypothetical protein
VSQIPITGYTSANPNNPTHYISVEYASKEEPEDWSTLGIELTTSWNPDISWNNPEPFNLAHWDISSLSPGFYLIKLTVNSPNGTVSDVSEVYINKDVAEGWPKMTGTTGHFIVDDLKPENPGMEISLIHTNKIYAFNNDGSLISGFPEKCFSLPTIASGGLNVPTALRIVTGDKEDGINIIVPNGNIQSYSMYPSNSTKSPVLADLDGDDDLEIVIGIDDGSVSIWESNGQEISAWKKETGNIVYYPPAIADIDANPGMEIIASCKDGNIYTWSYNNNDPLWIQELNNWVLSPPVVGNIDGDLNNTKEIVAYSRNGNIYCFSSTGDLVDGEWPVQILGDLSHPAALANIDGDPNQTLEIVIAGGGGNLYAFNHDGSEAMGNWPIQLSADKPGYLIQAPPVIADINNDEILEIIVGLSLQGEGYVYALDSQGNILSSDWPKPVFGSIKSISIFNMDEDENTEMIIGTTQGIFVIELDSILNQDMMPWPTFQQNMQRTGYIP